MANPLVKKAGPFPVWVWIAGAAAILYIIHARNASANANSANTAALADPNAVNPQLDPGTIDTSGLGGLGVGTGAGSDIGTGTGGSLGATTLADPSTPPDPTLTDPGNGSIAPNVVAPGLIGTLTAPRGTPPVVGATNPPRHRRGTPARVRRTGRPAKPVGHRAAAHPNEAVHATHPSHFREPPAATRINPTPVHAGGLTGPVTRVAAPAPARASRSGGTKNGPTQTQPKPAKPKAVTRSGNVGK